MIDIVIPLGKGSTWDNNELRYCLRSIDKHLSNFRDVYIVGERPTWLQNIIHVPAEDSGHPSLNVSNKILNVCAKEKVSKKIITFNDDFYLLKPVDASTYPYYYDRNLSNHLHLHKRNWFNEYIFATNAELQSHGFATKYFDIHNPIIYDKDLFPEVIMKFDFNKKLNIKSIYCNALNIPGIQMTDCKIKGWKKNEEVNAFIKDRHVFSSGDQCLIDMPTRKSPVKQLLYNLFPNKSKFEI